MNIGFAVSLCRRLGFGGLPGRPGRDLHGTAGGRVVVPRHRGAVGGHPWPAGGTRRARGVRGGSALVSVRAGAAALVRLLLGGQALALVLFTLIIPIEVIYAKESLGTTSAGFGILLASWGAGIVLGSLVYLLVRQRSSLGLDRDVDGGDRDRLSRHGHGERCCSRVCSRSSAVPETGSSGSRSSPRCRRPRRRTTRRGSWGSSSRSAQRCPASATSSALRWWHSARPGRAFGRRHRRAFPAPRRPSCCGLGSRPVRGRSRVRHQRQPG